MFSRKSPIFSHKSPCFPIKSPCFPIKSPIFSQKSPRFRFPRRLAEPQRQPTRLAVAERTERIEVAREAPKAAAEEPARVRAWAVGRHAGNEFSVGLWVSLNGPFSIANCCDFHGIIEIMIIMINGINVGMRIMDSGHLYQWEFQDPKMEVLYHMRSYFAGIFPEI